ncbi:hypothetical protein MLD38_017731 [Melastoma candidum]|uniref:Uncharacterized protein n=1 Tax=Melastoma candidum TaxID=119954 RepID=A0ACB9QQR6_9MYRT|nr:hypothetical protein MLD38_017731 [Melastoma candidum]
MADTQKFRHSEIRAMALSWNVVIVFLAVGFLCVLFVVVEALDVHLIRTLCNEEVFKSEGYSHQRVVELIHDILVHTPNATAGNNYYVHKTCDKEERLCGDFQDIYGHGKCNATVSEDDCRTCLGVAYEQMFLECPNRIGAQIQLKDCRLRYEKYGIADDE